MATAKKTAKRKAPKEKPVKTFNSFASLLKSKAKGGLPRGLTVDVEPNGDPEVVFRSGGGIVLVIDSDDMLRSLLRREGFRVK